MKIQNADTIFNFKLIVKEATIYLMQSIFTGDGSLFNVSTY